MKVEFDPPKREKTLVERDRDFARADEVFKGRHFTAEDVRQDYHERRYITVERSTSAPSSWCGHRAVRLAASSA